MAVFDRGDIVKACLNPVVGHEMQGEFRPCLVLSPKAYNKLGLTIVVPITQGGDYSRVKGFAVTLMGSGTETQGVVLVNGIRSLDLAARTAKKVETAPSEIVDEVLARLAAVLRIE
jgi:mRNA interferase ChpB